MRIKLFYISLFRILPIVLFGSCTLLNGSEKDYADSQKVYQLQLNPPTGSSYYYDITNESEMEMEVEKQTVTNTNRNSVSALYKVNRDTVGNIGMDVAYQKIHLYSKKGAVESEMDAANAAESFNPVEKMLGLLLQSPLHATITPAGEVVKVSGYDEMRDKLLAGINTAGESDKAALNVQWEQTVGKGMVQKNMDQLFRIFPKATVHVGEKWKLLSSDDAGLGLNIASYYQLKAINDDIAIIEVRGDITRSDTAGAVNGMLAATRFEGGMEGEYQVNAKTGMLINADIKASMEGEVETMGRAVPVKVKTRYKVIGKKEK